MENKTQYYISIYIAKQIEIMQKLGFTKDRIYDIIEYTFGELID